MLLCTTCVEDFQFKYRSGDTVWTMWMKVEDCNYSYLWRFHDDMLVYQVQVGYWLIVDCNSNISQFTVLLSTWGIAMLGKDASEMEGGGGTDRQYKLLECCCGNYLINKAGMALPRARSCTSLAQVKKPQPSSSLQKTKPCMCIEKWQGPCTCSLSNFDAAND